MDKEIRDLNSRMSVLEEEKHGLVYAWMEANGHGPRGDKTWPWEEGERATAERKKEINTELRQLREQRRRLEEAKRADRKARAGAKKAAQAAERESVTAECQICEGRQCLTREGRMVHHGYQRPGHGYIVGDCYGVHRLPYPATDALREYAGSLSAAVRDLEDDLESLLSALSITQSRDVYDRKTGRFRKELFQVLQCVSTSYAWEQAYLGEETRLKSKLRWFRGESTRVQRRIEKAGTHRDT